MKIASTHSSREIEAARTFLFVPADRPDRVVKALASGADFVIADLEDAVAAAAKPAAREHLAQLLQSLTLSDRRRVIVRINAAADASHEADLTVLCELQSCGPAALVVPKVDDVHSFTAVTQACPALPLIPLIETAKAFQSTADIASAPQVVRLAFGHLDLQAELGMDAGANQAELAPARWALVVASGQAGLPPPIDGVTPDFSDPVQLQADVRRSLRAGFGGKLCIHPGQVQVVHMAIAPTVEEAAWARRVIYAVEDAQGGAVQLDGRMVDAPVVKLAHRLLARVERVTPSADVS